MTPKDFADKAYAEFGDTKYYIGISADDATGHFILQVQTLDAEILSFETEISHQSSYGTPYVTIPPEIRARLEDIGEAIRSHLQKHGVRVYVQWHKAERRKWDKLCADADEELFGDESD